MDAIAWSHLPLGVGFNVDEILSHGYDPDDSNINFALFPLSTRVTLSKVPLLKS
jgi:hypothetical protein